MIKAIDRILHTMIRVRDLDASVNFYKKLGMKEYRREDYPDGEFTLVFMGYGDEETSSVIELTYNYGDNYYTHGTAFGHIALGVTDIHSVCDNLKSVGIKFLREPGPMKNTATNGARDIISFIEDPDGYKIELVENI
jgi:lactoylglutathione lyase